MNTYLDNLKNTLIKEFNGDVIPIPLVKNAKQPLYAHANITNDALWKKWDKQGYKEVMTQKADMGLVIRNHALIVVDFDDKNLSSVFEENIPDFQNTVKQSTKKGFHYFFKGTDKIKLSNQVRPFGETIDVDIITTWEKGTGGIITVYPSANKEWINDITTSEMKEMPDKFIEFYNDKALKKQPKKKDEQVKDCNNEDEYDFETLKKVVMGLSADRAVSFDCWHRVVWAVYNYCAKHQIADGKRDRLIHQFSQQDENKYNEDKVDDFIQNNSMFYENGYSMGTLRMYLKDDNPSLYQSIFAHETTAIYVQEEFEKTHFKVMRPLLYVEELSNGEFYFRDEAELKKAYRNKYVRIGDEDKPFINLWINDPKIRTYNSINFLPPPMVCPQDTYNMWRGFAIENVDVESSCNIEPVIKHIDILVNHDEKCRDYFLKWLADIIQNAGRLNGIAVVFKSDQGAGKNIFLEFFGNIIGQELYFETCDPIQELWSRFALGRKNRLLINIDEASGKDTFPNSEKMKNHITSPKFNYEDKGIRPITLDNFNRFIFTTNKQNPVKIEESDRRFVVFECSNEKTKDTQYFNELCAYFKEPANQKAFFEYLKHLDISNVDWINDRPITQLYKEIQDNNTPCHIKFFKYLVEHNDISAKLRFSGMGFYECCKDFLTKGGFNHNMSYTAFGRTMKQFIKADDNKGFIVKSMTKGCVVYKFGIEDLKEWLIENKFMNGCLIEDDEEDF